MFGHDVSPRFGMSPALLVADVDNGSVLNEGVIQIPELMPYSLPEFIAGQGVKVLICGGIHERFQLALNQRGVRVIWGVIGPARDALSEYMAGSLQPDRFLCPGRRRRGRGRGRGHGSGRGQGRL